MKQKTLEKPSRLISWLLWRTYFEFQSPYTVDDCIARLQSIQGTLEYRDTKVQELSDNGQVVNYDMEFNTRRISAWLTGRIEYRGDKGTRIQGCAGVDSGTLIALYVAVPILSLLMVLVSFPLSLSNLAVMLIMWAGVFIFGRIYSEGLKMELLDTIKHLLKD